MISTQVLEFFFANFQLNYTFWKEKFEMKCLLYYILIRDTWKFRKSRTFKPSKAFTENLQFWAYR